MNACPMQSSTQHSVSRLVHKQPTDETDSIKCCCKVEKRDSKHFINTYTSIIKNSVPYFINYDAQKQQNAYLYLISHAT